MRYTNAVLAALATSVSAHTWVEQLMVIAPNGTLTGAPGFPRANVKRDAPGFGDPAMVNLIPGNGRIINQILATDLICKDSQSKQSQTSGSPRLQASAGDNVALRYQENGHVSLPQGQPGKPQNRGTVYVYGTTQPQQNDAFLSIHRVWNAAGTGGDGRGLLLSTQNYDDGQCYQVNGGQISTTRQKTFTHATSSLMGADLWCQQDIQIPTTAPSGKPYTLYWVWDWPTLPGTAGFPDGKQEIYTTCMDVDITANGGQAGNGDTSAGQNKAAGNIFAVGQDFGNAGIQTQLANIANPTAVVGDFIPFSGVSGETRPTDDSGFTSYLTETATAVQTTTRTQIGSSQTGASQPASSQPASSQPASLQPGNSQPGSPQPPQQTPGASRTHRYRPSVAPFNTQDPFPNSNGGPNPNFYPNPNPNQGPNTFTPLQPTSQLNTATAISTPAPIPSTSTLTVTPAPTTSTLTFTASAAAIAPSTITHINSIFQTVTQTKMETVYISSGVRNQRRARAEPTSVTSVNLDVTTSVYPSIRACSQTERAYRLRGRHPLAFYIIPEVKGNGSEQGVGTAGC